ncbi:MAG: dihydrodipicolinate reductase C-terminal domain-containing protein, partial [Gammaproteobacteria bacterium]
RLELVHRVTDRAAFALGALRAARWVAAQKPGLFSLDDVLWNRG